MEWDDPEENSSGEGDDLVSLILLWVDVRANEHSSYDKNLY